LVRTPEDWANQIQPDRDLWPASREDVGRFEQAVELLAERTFGKGRREFVYRLEMAPEYMEDIVQGNTRRPESLGAIAKRLLKSQAEATRDHGLKDEPVRGQAGVRRFRVTRSERVHYRYAGRETIRLLRYFGAGGHDAGL
jgi:hypothetical protein